MQVAGSHFFFPGCSEVRKGPCGLGMMVLALAYPESGHLEHHPLTQSNGGLLPPTSGPRQLPLPCSSQPTRHPEQCWI